MEERRWPTEARAPGLHTLAQSHDMGRNPHDSGDEGEPLPGTIEGNMSILSTCDTMGTEGMKKETYMKLSAALSEVATIQEQ